jgi:hypothetical protein
MLVLDKHSNLFDDKTILLHCILVPHWPNKLECLFLAGFSSLVYCLLVRIETIKVLHSVEGLWLRPVKPATNKH